MTNSVIKKLLIKQVIGRLLLDTKASECAFELHAHGDSWQVIVHNVEPAAGEEIARLSEDLNLFYFEEDTATGDIRKWWLYDLDRPQFAWQPEERTLQLVLSSRVSYSNEKV